MHRGKKRKEAGSGWASPDLGQIGPAGSPASPAAAEAVRATPSDTDQRDPKGF
jgi:hypothetical protein